MLIILSWLFSVRLSAKIVPHTNESFPPQIYESIFTMIITHETTKFDLLRVSLNYNEVNTKRINNHFQFQI
jgi:hypothetical protein